MYKVKISHNQLIDLLDMYYDKKVYPNITENSKVTKVEIGYSDIIITIGEKIKK